MKCVNCGNEDPQTLWDEGDTYYCSICCHRTLIKTGKDDLIECPYCHRLRDRKALICEWCGSQWNEELPLTKNELKELDNILSNLKMV